MASKKRGLGRGLAALINEDIESEEEIDKDVIKEIDINLIVPNKYQPRVEFKEENLQELANSININGLIQPIVVKKDGKKYEIIAGERRFRAAKMAGLEKMPSIIKDIDEEMSAKLALIENIQREDLNPIEEGQAYKKLMDKYNLTQEQLSMEMGKSRSYISNTIRLLKLDDKILQFIVEGKMSTGHAKVLLGVKDKKTQIELSMKIIEENLSVRETEDLINKISDKNNITKNKQTEKSSNIIAVEESLMHSLGTKVQLKGGNKKGKIEIEYYGLEDLERLIDLLTK